MASYDEEIREALEEYRRRFGLPPSKAPTWKRDYEATQVRPVGIGREPTVSREVEVVPRTDVCKWHQPKPVEGLELHVPDKLRDAEFVKARQSLANRLREWPHCVHGGEVEMVPLSLGHGTHRWKFVLRCSKCR